MAVTQIEAVKAMPYLLSNLMALGTCFVYALVILVICYYMPIFIKSWLFKWMGIISYELYLVHAFSLSLVENNLLAIVEFIAITLVGAVVLHFLMKKGFSYVKPDKKHSSEELKD